jgi:iron complex outermembrane receptor protein
MMWRVIRHAKGLVLALRGVAAGEREGNYAYYGNPFQLPGYVGVDAFAAYKWQVHKVPVTAQFNIRNLLDKTYYESTILILMCRHEMAFTQVRPLMAIGSLKVEF